jgi:hypothetical protein
MIFSTQITELTMTARLLKRNCLQLGIALLIAISPSAALADGPKSAQQFAEQYMAAFNKKDSAALKKLRFPLVGKSQAQDFINSMTDADMQSGTQYTKFELLPVAAKDTEPQMGPDGSFYKPNLKPINMLKVTSQTKNGTTSTTFPIGEKDGVFYQVSIAPADEAMPAYQFGWQRCSLPKSNWSVMLPNESEPGKAALEKQFGKDALQDPDVYGVVNNTASIKTSQHYMVSGAEGKRLRADDNNSTYRASCTTFAPETLKEWFSDPKKNLADSIDQHVRALPGKLIQQKDIEMAGSPGREFEIQGKDGTYCLGRAYWIKDALYELTLESKSNKPDAEVANKFLSSLAVN